MKIVAERKSILGALAFVTRYADRAGKIPIIAHVHLHAVDGKIVVTATNLDQSARDVISAEIGEAGTICLPAELLRKAIDVSVGSEVSIDADAKSAKIVCGKQRFTLPVLPPSDFPLLAMLDSDKGEALTLSGELLASIMKEVAFAVMDPRGAYYLTGVSWRTDGKKLHFTATDTHRLSTLSVDSAAEIDIIVPPFDVPSWEGDVQIRATELFIRLQSGSQVVASKLIEAKYPEIARLFPASPSPILIDRGEFLAAVKRVGLVSNSVLIVGRDGVATFSASSAGQDAGDEVAYEGADFQIAFPVERLSTVLASFDCEVIQFGFVSHDATSVITDPRDDTRSVLAFPISDFRIVEYLPRVAAE